MTCRQMIEKSVSFMNLQVQQAIKDEIKLANNYSFMYKHAKNFKFFNSKQTTPSQHKQSEITRIFAKFNKAASKIAEPISKDRYVKETFPQRNQIIYGSSLKLIQPQLLSHKVYNPRPSVSQSSNKNKSVIRLSLINKHNRASSMFLPDNSVIHDEESKIKNNQKETNKCQEIRFITDLSPYQNKITKSFTSSNRKRVSVRLLENKQIGIKKQMPVLSLALDQLKNAKSESYLVMQYPSKKIILSKKSRVKMEIASLTKIMTFYVVLQIIKNNKIDPHTEIVVVGMSSTKICGTSAKLEAGEEYTVQSLLYGMMLPSGNDAANQLAIWGGQYLTSNPKRKAKIYAFVQQMNKYSCKLGLSSTNFCNSHGLTHAEALSTTKDIALLCCACWESELFKRVVNCKNYTLNIKSESKERIVLWKNTNKLLNLAGFVGLKTGTTISAGPCLASAYQFRNKIYITVVLKAPKSISRFKETCEILAYSLQRLFTDLDQSQKSRLQELKQKSYQFMQQSYNDQIQSEQAKQVSKGQGNRARTEASTDIFRTTH